MVRAVLSAGAARFASAAIAQALVAGTPMPAADPALPREVQKKVAEYRQCEATFKSGLTPPPGADANETALYERRVAVERVVACLFPGRDAAKVAAGYALDVDLDHESAFSDELLRDLPVKWLAPYLNLIAGHAKGCDGRSEPARAQLDAARKGGNALIREAAAYLAAENACLTPPR